ncbi:MAG: hypothetical protein V1865_03115 [bacterium]
MYKKIALVFFALAFIVVIAGAYFFFWGKDNNNKQVAVKDQTSEEIVRVAKDQEEAKQDEIDIEKQRAEMVAELKQTIKTKIKEKDALIRSTGTGRPYTEDEVDFVLNPRENIINEMKASGEITDEQIELLYSTN